ncbi:hypothetical protein EU546_02830 [Candidatus Thorarchaeota archaeon]|nr:MAG: hypothetical protein EU546_02830 [Candidatus Thorarchaeota archaeon]
MGYRTTNLRELGSISFYREKGIVLFGHGFIFSLAQLPVGLAGSYTLALVVILTAQFLGSSAVYLAIFAFYLVTILLLGAANAKMSEYIYDVQPDYGLYPLLIQGVVFVVASRVLVGPLSDLLENTTNPVLGSLIIVFRYTVIAFIIGIICYALGTTLVQERRVTIFGHSPEEEIFEQELPGEHDEAIPDDTAHGDAEDVWRED